MNAEIKQKIEELVAHLNKCSDEYYNKNNPSISDAEYDALFDELLELERKTGHILPESPTVRAGYTPVSELKKVTHKSPLLSLAKTKNAADIHKMAQQGEGYLALKLDGLTLKLTYENGRLIAAATRGDGETGEDVTHTARFIKGIPQQLREEVDITVIGEGIIDIKTFHELNEKIEEESEKYSTPRNLVSGSVRQLDPKVCKSRGVSFMPFNVANGLDFFTKKSKKLQKIADFGFFSLPTTPIKSDTGVEKIEQALEDLKNLAAEKNLPIDGVVFTFDDVEFSKSQGRTSHHFKDSIAYKFGDPTEKSVLQNINWNISRTGQLTPIAEFAPVMIDNTKVEKASLHNITFIESLKLKIGDEILVSKRNMIIPYIEENLSVKSGEREDFTPDTPEKCPVCNGQTEVKATGECEEEVKVLFCKNKDCPGRQIKKFTHFVSKGAMNIEGLSEATLKKFIQLKFIKNPADIYALGRYKEQITELEGFGEKSYDNLISSIERSKKTTLANVLVAMNIPQIGKNAARAIEDFFSGSAEKFKQALDEKFDFSGIEDFGEITNSEIYKWAENGGNIEGFDDILRFVHLRQTAVPQADEQDEFFGKTVVITGSFEKYSRDELAQILRNKGARVTGTVSKNTDILICGEKAGSKLEKAEKLEIVIVGEQELLSKLP